MPQSNYKPVERPYCYACVTAADPEKPSSFRLFLCTAVPEGIAVEAEKQADEKIRSYNAWGMLPLGLFTLRWNIETSYYEAKTFWSFRDYMVRSVTGVINCKRLLNQNKYKRATA